MDNNELNLNSLIKSIIKDKILFMATSLVLSIILIIYVLNIDKSYKSTLVYSLPLNKGVETQYILNSLSEMKAQQINYFLGLKDDSIKINKLIIYKSKVSSSQTLGNIDIITSMPDEKLIAKKALIDYINNVEYIKELIKIEDLKNTDLIKTANIEYEKIMNNPVQNQVNSNGALILPSPIDVKSKLYTYKKDKLFLNSIITLAYNTSPLPYKPSYSMLVVLSIIISLITAVTIVLLKNVVLSFKDE